MFAPVSKSSPSGVLLAQFGQLPLHIAAERSASEAVVRALLVEHLEAAQTKDGVRPLPSTPRF